MNNYYFLMCLLPPMPAELGEKTALKYGEIAEVINRNIYPEDIDVTHAHLHFVDVHNWEQMDRGRDFFMEGGLLSSDDLKSGRNLPNPVRAFREEKERGIHRINIYDRLWELYYSDTHAVAERSGCRFLIDYLAWEIELRSNLAASRVREKGGNIDDHAVMTAFRPRDFSHLAAQMKNKNNPMLAERCLDEERLRQISRFEGSASFSIDTLLAYVSRSAIYARWERISETFDIETYLLPGGSM